jgi:hypothetical protein
MAVGFRASVQEVRLGQFFVNRTFRWQDIDKFYGAPCNGNDFAARVLLRDGRKFPCLGIRLSYRLKLLARNRCSFTLTN